MSKYYLSAAIPYVNAEPHIGTGVDLMMGDALIRYWRSKLGEENVFSSRGTDENSLKNVRAAEKAGEDIQSFVERHAEIFKSLQPLLNTSFDAFIRTREKRHMEGAQKLWQACRPEDIYKKAYKGLYCVGCEMFYTEKEVPDEICPVHKKPLELVEEENYFFKLSNYQDQLTELIESDKLRIVPKSRKNEILSFIKSGLLDFSISRSQERAKHWGVPVPGDPSQVMYVWFDALSNYITVLDYASEGDLFQSFWLNSDSNTVQIIGKDILRFHAVYWPAMLLSAQLPYTDELFVHGFITSEGEKMSKSLGNVIHPKDIVQEYGIDATRYYFLREIPSHGDGDYSKKRMEERYAELANRLGNLVGRVAAMANSYFEGELEDVKKDWTSIDKELEEFMRDYDIKKYIDRIFDIVDDANEIIDKKEPFKLVKEDENAAKSVLSEVAELIRYIAQNLEPIIPQTAQEITRRYSGPKILKGDPLFPKRD